MKNLKYYKVGCLALAMSGAITLTGCGETTYIPDQTQLYDTIDSNAEGEVKIDPQVLDVIGEDFKLVVDYDIIGDGDNKWRVTSDKDLYISAHTEGLPEGYKVWIDNVHIDTFIISSKKEFNGIMQDTMDDRIHNSLMMGFPVGDDVYYSSINLIQGQDEDFIKGTFYGYQSAYLSGEVEEKRYTDEDYLENGVYANKIGLVFGLLIQRPGDEYPRAVDVKSNIVVTVYNRVEKVDNNIVKVYEYDRDGNYTVVDEYELEQPKQLIK